MTYPLGQTVTVVTRTPGSPDAYGNDTWTETTVDVDGCAVWPHPANSASGVEIQTDRDTVFTNILCMFPAGTAVAAISRVVLPTGSYEVEGDPADYLSPLTGTTPGRLVNLRKVTG